MTIEEAIEARLLDDPDVSEFVGDRIYQLIGAQFPVLPAIRLQLIDNPQDQHLRGPDGTTPARIQADVYGDSITAAKPYEDVSRIAEAVNSSLVYAPFTVEGSPDRILVGGCRRMNRRVLYEGEENRLIRVFQDYRIWYRVLSD